MMVDTKRELQDHIFVAFHDVSPPAKPDGAASYPFSESVEETEFFWGKDWSDLSLEDFENSWAFYFFPEERFLYFFGALIWLSLRANSVEISGDIVSSLITPIRHKKHILKPRLAKRMETMSERQLSATKEFLKWFSLKAIPGQEDEVKVFWAKYFANPSVE